MVYHVLKPLLVKWWIVNPGSTVQSVPYILSSVAQTGKVLRISLGLTAPI